MPSAGAKYARPAQRVRLTRDKLRIVIMGDAATVRKQLDGYRVEVTPMSVD